MIMRELRSGVSFGYYYNESTYIVGFTDIPPNVSFKKHFKDEYDYLPSLQYMSPLLLNTIIQDFFNATLNKVLADDIECQNSINIPTIMLNKAKRFIDKLNQYTEKIKVSYGENQSIIRSINGCLPSNEN